MSERRLGKLIQRNVVQVGNLDISRKGIGRTYVGLRYQL